MFHQRALQACGLDRGAGGPASVGCLGGMRYANREEFAASGLESLKPRGSNTLPQRSNAAK